MRVKDYSFLDDCKNKLKSEFICGWEYIKPITLGSKCCEHYENGYCTHTKYCSQKVLITSEYDFINGKWVKVEMIKK